MQSENIVEKDVIIVTDGDYSAKNAVELATKNIGGRCISLSAGNPTMLKGLEIIKLIQVAHHSPVVIMVDDCGHKEEGHGEKALKEIMSNDSINILGVIAVASNDCDEMGVEVDFSITREGKKIDNAVDKYGVEISTKEIKGDTISVLNNFKNKIPVIVGIGDPGKMEDCDNVCNGSPITTIALKEILNHRK